MIIWEIGGFVRIVNFMLGSDVGNGKNGLQEEIIVNIGLSGCCMRI